MKDRIETDGWSDQPFGVPLLGGFLGGIVSFVTGYLVFLGFVAGTGSGLDYSKLIRSLKEVGHFFYNSFQVSTLRRLTAITEQRPQDGGEKAAIKVKEVTEIWFNPITDSTREIRRRVYVEGQFYRENTFTEAVTDVSLTFPSWVYLAVPVVVLFATGFVLAYRFIDTEHVGFAETTDAGGDGKGVDEETDEPDAVETNDGTDDVDDETDDGNGRDDVDEETGDTGGDEPNGHDETGYEFSDTQVFAIRTLIGAGTITLGFLLVVLLGTYLLQIEGTGTAVRPDRVDTIIFGFAYAAICSTAGVTVGQLVRKLTRTEPNGDTTSC